MKEINLNVSETADDDIVLTGDEEDIEVDPAAARSLAERAGERQDILDARVVVDNVNREFAGDEAFAGMDGRQGGSRQPMPGGRRGPYVIPRNITVTRVAGGEDRPSKRRKVAKVATSDAFPEHEYPEGFHGANKRDQAQRHAAEAEKAGKEGRAFAR